MRRLGVDPGSRRIGLSLSDEDGRIAMPHSTVERRGAADAARRVAEVVQETGAGEVVMGLPLRLDGTKGDAARRARSLGEAIASRSDVPVVYWDERLTTVQAERALREADVRGAARRQVVDQAAATVLLQSYLDAKTERTWSEDESELDVPAPPEGRRGRGDRGRRRGG